MNKKTTVTSDKASGTGRHRSEATLAVHETAAGLYGAKLIEKRSMRNFDNLCLTPIEPMTPKDIRAIREKEHVSQAILASYLNVTTSLVSQWERGERKPSGPSLKLLTLASRNGLGSIT